MCKFEFLATLAIQTCFISKKSNAKTFLRRLCNLVILLSLHTQIENKLETSKEKFFSWHLLVEVKCKANNFICL